MDQETLQRAIEPFYSTKGVGKGTGLGLSMVHGLLSQMGGGLTLESVIGEGTTAEMWLRISMAGQAWVEDELVSGENDAGTHEGRVLLVDDEDLVRTATADMLTDLGYTVVETDSAEQALELLRSGARPDLIVTDHLMPGMNGVELIGEVRDLHPTLPILIVSGYAEMHGIPPEMPRLAKPFRVAELATVLNALRFAEAAARPVPSNV